MNTNQGAGLLTDLLSAVQSDIDYNSRDIAQYIDELEEKCTEQELKIDELEGAIEELKNDHNE